MRLRAELVRAAAVCHAGALRCSVDDHVTDYVALLTSTTRTTVGDCFRRDIAVEKRHVTHHVDDLRQSRAARQPVMTCVERLYVATRAVDALPPPSQLCTTVVDVHESSV